VNVTVFKGTVQLSGFVDIAAQKSKAEDIAKQVVGVKDVANSITVKERNAGASGESVDDKTLTGRVHDALHNNPDYKFSEVNVAVLDGTVQLSGFVDMSVQKSRAADIARQVQGVKNVRNNITVKP
jgi:hyperosmotically inducible protein